MHALESKSQRIYIKFLAPCNIICIVSPQKSLHIFDLILWLCILESNLAKYCKLRINITLPLKSAFLTWDTHFSLFENTYTSYGNGIFFYWFGIFWKIVCFLMAEFYSSNRTTLIIFSVLGKKLISFKIPRIIFWLQISFNIPF